MRTIGIFGGSGFVGAHIASQLREAGKEVIIFSRRPKQGTGDVSFAQWDPSTKTIDAAAVAKLDAVVSLAGSGVVDKRWSKAYKQEILDSRVVSTHFLHEQLAKHAPDCRAFVAASATGYYGPDRAARGPFKEDDEPFHDFLADVCRQWEEASAAASDRYRTSIIRIGIVLGNEGGAYPQFAGPQRFGITPVLGSGRQIVSWIHVEDLAALFIRALTDEGWRGVYNGVAPSPAMHATIMKTIASVKGGLKIPIPVPGFALRIGLGESAIEVLKSCTVSAQHVLQSGFRFRFRDIRDAVTDLEKKP
jgi:uncharacterized protein (TIGR01777 family)